MSETFEIEISEGNRLKFSSEKKLREFLNGERTFWSGFGIEGSFSSVRHQLHGPISSADVFESVRTPDNLRRLRDELSTFSSSIIDGRYLLSSDPLAVFIQKEAEQDLDHAERVLKIFTRPNEAIGNSLGDFAAAFTLQEFLRGLSKSSVASLRSSVRSIHDSSVDTLSDFELRSNQLLEELNNAITNREKRARVSAKTLADFLEKTKKRVTEQEESLNKKLERIFLLSKSESGETMQGILEQARNGISTFESSVKNAIALQAPISYWSEKSSKHRLATIFSGFAFMLYCCFVVYFFSSRVGMIFGDVKGFLVSVKDLGLPLIVLIAGTGAAALIFARVIYRIFSSQLHLWNDASERVTMVKTYLALAERGHAKEEFLGSLMARLFAPASDGVIKDDFGSIGPLDYLAKQVGK